MTPQFKVTSIVVEDNLFKVTVDSDQFNLNSFNHTKLNGAVPEDGVYTIPKENVGALLTLVGYFNDLDTDPIQFASIAVDNLFNVEVGFLNEAKDEYTKLNIKSADFNTDCVLSLVTTQSATGHMVVAIPTRSYPNIKYTILCQGMLNIDKAWSIDNFEDANAIKNLLDANFSEPTTYLVNSFVTNANEKWLFQIFKNS
jgi:hypothetical protein